MGFVDHVLTRCVDGKLPVGFVQVAPCDDQSVAVAEFVGRDVLTWGHAEELGAAGIFPLGLDRRLFRGHPASILDVPGPLALGAMIDLLKSGLFRIIVVAPFDAVGPGSERWGGLDRYAWLRQMLPGLRPHVQRARATVFLICYQSGGDRVLRAWSSLTIKLHQNARGIVVSVEGRDSTPGNAPFLLSDLEGRTG
jgi:hypothetical protein